MARQIEEYFREEDILAAVTLSSTAAVYLALLVVLVLGSFSGFQFDIKAGGIALLVSFAWSALGHGLIPRIPHAMVVRMVMISNALVCAFLAVAALTTHTGQVGALSLYPALWLMTASIHGFGLYCSAQTPQQGLLTLGGTALLLPLAIYEGTVGAWFGLMLLGAIFMFWSGSLASRISDVREEVDAAKTAHLLTNDATHTMTGTLGLFRGAVHDMNNKITPLVFGLELLEDLDDEKEKTDLIWDMRSCAGELADVVNQCLKPAIYSRREPEPFGVRSAIEAMTALHAIRKLKATTLRVEPLGADAVSMVGGQVSLVRALENLVVNSHEAGAERIAIEGSLLPLERVYALTISDDGPGFPTALCAEGPIPHVTTKAKGNGLGLCGVRDMVVASGGTIVFRNSPRGAVVEIRLPTPPHG